MYKPRVFQSGLMDSRTLVLLANQQFIKVYLPDVSPKIAAKQTIRQIKDLQASWAIYFAQKMLDKSDLKPTIIQIQEGLKDNFSKGHEVDYWSKDKVR